MGNRPQANRPAERRQFSLGWALALSVLVHVLLVLLGGWLPMVRPSQAAELDETVLQFSFAEPVETDQTSTPEGDVPFDTPPAPQPELTPPTEPTFQNPPPSVDVVEPLPAPLTAETEPVPEQPEEQPREGAAVDPVEEPIETDDPPAEESLEPLTPEIPAGDRDPMFAEPGESDSVSEATEPSSRSFDLDGAIQDFGRVLDRARANAPPPDSVNGPPRNVFVPDPTELSTTGYGLGNLTFETADFDWSDYARAVYTQIWRAWHNRLLRMTNEFEKWAYVNREPNLRHANQIRFVIERSGQVTGIMIEGPSGCVPLDNSATQALAEVILPPLPDAFPKEREVVHAQFIAIGEIRYMKPVLTRMKALNYF